METTISASDYLLSPKNTARYLNIPLPTLYYLMQQGKIPGVAKIGGRYRVDRRQIDAGLLNTVIPSYAVIMCATRVTPDQLDEIRQGITADSVAIIDAGHKRAQEATHVVVTMHEIEVARSHADKQIILLLDEGDALDENDLNAISGMRVTYHFTAGE
jgi:excisionase family DNA binding protein